jgi:hypothetical protein
MTKFFFGKKTSEFYNGLLIKADPGLHQQLGEVILNKFIFLNFIILPLRFLVSEIIDGWCILASARKP